MTQPLRLTSIASAAALAISLSVLPTLADSPQKSPSDKKAGAQTERKDEHEVQKQRVIRWQVRQSKDGDKTAHQNMAFRVIPLAHPAGDGKAEVDVLLFRPDGKADHATLQKLSKDGVIVIVIPEGGQAAAATARIPAIQLHREGAKIRVEAHREEDHEHGHHDEHGHHEGDHDHGHSHDGDHDGHADKKGHGDDTKQIRLNVEVVEDAQDGQQKRRVIILRSDGKEGERQFEFVPKDGKILQLLRLHPDGNVEVEVEHEQRQDGHAKAEEEKKVAVRALKLEGAADLEKLLSGDLKKAAEAVARAKAAQAKAIERAQAAHRAAVARLNAARSSGNETAELEKRLDRIEQQLDRLSRLVRELVEEVEEHQADEDDDDDDD